jgi:hypothetical protein
MTTRLNRRELLAGLLAATPAAMLAWDCFGADAPVANRSADPPQAARRVLVTISKKAREERFKSDAPASVDWDDIVVRMPAGS